MKKIKYIVFVGLILSFLLCACGKSEESSSSKSEKSNSYDTSKTTISAPKELTSSDIEIIKSKIKDDDYCDIIRYTIQLTYDLDGYYLNSYEVTNHRKINDYTYKVFGIMYYTDDYNRSYKEVVNVEYTKDSSGKIVDNFVFE